MKMGRRLSRGRGIGYVSIQICSALTASPARTALPAGYFDRNESHVIYGDRTLAGYFHSVPSGQSSTDRLRHVAVSPIRPNADTPTRLLRSDVRSFFGDGAFHQEHEERQRDGHGGKDQEAIKIG